MLPASTSVSAFDFVPVYTCTWYPASKRCSAMLLPITPIPIKPIVCLLTVHPPHFDSIFFEYSYALLSYHIRNWKRKVSSARSLEINYFRKIGRASCRERVDSAG